MMIVPNGNDNDGSLEATEDVAKAMTGLLRRTRSDNFDSVEIGLTREPEVGVGEPVANGAIDEEWSGGW
ncbi:hypothetical protein L6452_08844 [Arctium lappa]|uniref:Uncharacterized protein n=1 Tax=Arctium lappa TaxID=4217 RepID=A0ACB9DJI5_ARCLA|nr:hypothetical protein L6452_08844 [Arctium lappa]